MGTTDSAMQNIITRDAKIMWEKWMFKLLWTHPEKEAEFYIIYIIVIIYNYKEELSPSKRS